MGPKIRREKRRAASTMVQKYLRGYLSHKHSYKDMAETKIEMTAQFFQTIRNNLELSAQIYLAYYFRRFLKARRAEEVALAETKKKNKNL
jgi:hypothetical protein